MPFVGKITDSAGSTGLIGSTLYGTCGTAAATAAKVVTCADFDKLLSGVTIHVKFTYSNTAASPTLKVGSTDAKNVYRYGTTVPGTTVAASWPAGSIVSFTYDGTSWIMNDYHDDTNTDTKVTQAYSTTNNTYPVLLSSVAGISSTASRGDQTSIVNNQIYANPSNGRLYANIPEAFLFWGGKDFSGSYGPIDAAMIPTLSANRAAFYPGDRIVVEYTRDGGTTWLDYGADNTTKTALFTTSASFVVGKSTTSNIATPSCKLRITIKNTNGKLYSYIQKIAIFVSTGGSTGCTVDIKGRTRTNVEAESDTWANLKTAAPISGYSGWNILQTNFITYGNASSKSSQYDEIRFIFSITSHGSSAAGLSVSKIYMYGGVGWTTPSTLASTGLIYSYDASQNVVFPANITCGGTFIAKADVYTDALSSGALNMRNSDIYGCNSIKFADLCDSGAEGIQFYRDGTHADSFYGKSGKLYYHPNRAYGSTAGDVYTILHTGNLTITQSLTSGTKIGTITIDGTGTDLYAPSNTDTKVTQTAVGSTYTNYRPLVIGASNSATAGFSPSTVTDTTFTTQAIYCQPASGTIFATKFDGFLAPKLFTSSTIDSTAGSCFFYGDNLLGNGNYDWIGIQGDSGSDKFQLMPYAGNMLLYRQNDNGGSSTAWQDWISLLSPSSVTANDGITATITTTTIGTDDGAVTFNSGVRLSHTNSVTAVTSNSLLKFKYDAQGHITGSTAVVKADITALGIPGSDTNTTYSLSGAASNATYVVTLTPSTGSATTATVPAGTTSTYGLVKLSSSTSSTSTELAATPSAVKSAYDLAAGYVKQLTSSTVDSTDGNFFFWGNDLIGGMYDWVGIQSGSAADVWQMTASSDRPLFRQKDTDTWSDWVGLLTPGCITSGDNVITVTENSQTIGSGSTAVTFKYGVSLSHKTYTSKSSGVYKITVDGTGHVSAASALDAADVSGLINKLSTGSSTPVDADYYVSQYVGGGTSTTTYHRRPMSALWSYVKGKADSVYAPISHTHSYIPLAGSDQISGDLKFNATGKGIYLKDSGSNVYAGIIDNGTNLWIGAKSSSAAGHVGKTYISTGYDSTNSKGNMTINVYLPNASNSSHSTEYPILHTGNLLAGTGLSIATAASTSYTGNTYTINHTDSVTAVTTAGLYKIKYNASGHITGTASVAASDLPSHTHPYLPLAGGTMNTSATITIPSSETNRCRLTSHGTQFQVPNSSWARSITVFSDDWTTAIGSFGAFSSNNTETQYFYMGTGYNNTWLRLYKDSILLSDADNAGFVINYRPANLSSGYSGSFVKMIPGDTYGYGLFFGYTHGGTTMISSGESGKSLFDTAFDASLTPYSSAFSVTEERMIISSDTNITFITGADSLATTAHEDWTNLRTIYIDSQGVFCPSIDKKGQIGYSTARWNWGYFANVNISNSSWAPLTIHREGTGTAAIKFTNVNNNTTQTLGYLTLGSTTGMFRHYLSNGSTYYDIIDTSVKAVSGAWFDKFPWIASDGAMGIGSSINFHTSNTATSTYDWNITAASTTLKIQNSSKSWVFNSNGLLTIPGQISTIGNVYIKCKSSDKQRVTLADLMAHFISQGYIHASTWEHVIIQSKYSYDYNDILQFTVDGIYYEMHLCGATFEFIGMCENTSSHPPQSYGTYLLKITAAAKQSIGTISSGYYEFPSGHTATYHLSQNTGYNPHWTIDGFSNGREEIQPLLADQTWNNTSGGNVSNASVTCTDAIMTQWKLLYCVMTCTISTSSSDTGEGSYGFRFNFLIPVKYLLAVNGTGVSYNVGIGYHPNWGSSSSYGPHLTLNVGYSNNYTLTFTGSRWNGASYYLKFKSIRIYGIM